LVGLEFISYLNLIQMGSNVGRGKPIEYVIKIGEDNFVKS
jgi:hypothetical protein